MTGARSPRPARRPSAPAAAPSSEGAFEAEVAGLLDDGRAQVRRLEGPSALLACRVAVPGYHASTGDRVVVLAAPAGSAPAWILGVVSAASGGQGAPLVRDPSGATASAEPGALVLRDPSGAVVASYEPDARTLRVGAGLARVELGAPDGTVAITARDVEISAARRAAVAAPELDVTSGSARLRAEEASISAKVVRTVAEELASTAERWEVQVGRLIERAAETYREARLAETRAERVRTVAQAAFDVIAGRTTLLSDDDTVIDGKRVLLG